MLPSFAKETIEVQRIVYVEDDRGEYVTNSYDSHTIAGCSVQPGASVEFTDRRDTVQITATLYASPGADIQAGDKIICGGRRYEVDGEPTQWKSPTGRVSHTLAALKTWEG
jgi:hypothetical protein|nr:MAG TPA: Minor capsid protein [Caudoviricetes sp.]